MVGFEPWEEFPFNNGMLCPKGVKRYLQNEHPDRLLTPLVRDDGAGLPTDRLGHGARSNGAARFNAFRPRTAPMPSPC